MFLVEIIPDVWLGDTNFSSTTIKEKGIQYVINCQEDLFFFGRSRDYIDSIKESLMRDEIKGLNIYLHKMTEQIFQHLKKHESILIMCENGQKKSPLLIIGYLIRYGHMSLESAINVINMKSERTLKLNQLDIIALQYFQKRTIEILKGTSH